jgi:hypothetical protein
MLHFVRAFFADGSFQNHRRFVKMKILPQLAAVGANAPRATPRRGQPPLHQRQRQNFTLQAPFGKLRFASGCAENP